MKTFCIYVARKKELKLLGLTRASTKDGAAARLGLIETRKADGHFPVYRRPKGKHDIYLCEEDCPEINSPEFLDETCRETINLGKLADRLGIK